jgi:acetyl/propionyl-CoA carboxylase alpha subunit
VAFLRRVVASRSFATADLDTALIERERTRCSMRRACRCRVAAAGVVAPGAGGRDRRCRIPDPWSRRDGWRIHGGARRRFDLEMGKTHHVAKCWSACTTARCGWAWWERRDLRPSAPAIHWATTATT